jgi:hypothetical protein
MLKRLPGREEQVRGSRFENRGSRFKVQGSRFKVQGSKLKTQNSKLKTPHISAFPCFGEVVNLQQGVIVLENPCKMQP